MPKRPDALETTLLAIELLRRIPRGRKITTGELHQQLKTTTAGNLPQSRPEEQPARTQK